LRNACLLSIATTDIIRIPKGVNAQDTPAEPTPDLPLEIAHLLLLDVVGYSKLLVNEQIELLRKLNQIVRNTQCFRAAEASGELNRVPTGDGMALLFFHSPEEPVRCALETSRTLQEHPEIQVRMGVHSGPVNRVTDVNDKTNFAGSGINVAQRVLDCADAGHILLSGHVAEDLIQYRHWQPYLHDLGECEVKHGLRLHLFNLYKEDLGNPEVPQKLQRRKWRQASGAVHPVNAPRWPKIALIVALLVSAVALVISSLIFFHRTRTSTITTVVPRPTTNNAAAAISEKSIAVLPFENLSDEKENAYFADGVQDEILTNLARVADLRVISRSSTMPYKDSPRRNLRDIAKTLGVSHVVEGSVQRSGGRVRVNAQLIDAKTDMQLWGQSYDRDLVDVFAIENELAQQIVLQLKSRLSPQEKAAIEEKPTADLVAHDLYIRAKTLIATAVFSTPLQEGLFEAVRLLNRAIERDPAFALAYYQLAHAHDLIYLVGTDHTPARLAMADAAIQSLTRLLPNSGEAHLALAKHLYWGYRDYDRARQELNLARKSLPNDPLPFQILGFIDRRQGRWEESTKNLKRAVELDPQNPALLQEIASSYHYLRRYADEERVLDRAIALTPKEAALRASRAAVELDWHADTRPLLSTVETIRAEDSGEAKNVAALWLVGLLCERDFDAALRALAALPIAGCHEETIPFPRFWCEGVVAQMRGDTAAARAAFTSVRTKAAKLVAEQPDYAEAHCVLGMADAALGHKEDAIREGRRAVELLPVTKDAIIGPLLVQYLALIYAWTGEKDLALEQLATVASIPGPVSYGELRLHPYWDSLRGDPRFDKIVALLAPK
jgi:TolB-like protein/class 3 adenylate cyclase/Flp pilus assembly protein TadD